MIRKILFVLAATFALASCDTLAVRTVGGPTFLYKVNDLDYAGGGRELRVVVLSDGTVLGGQNALQPATVSGLQSAVGSKTRFSATPQNFDREFKVVALFNPASGVTGSSLCRETEGAKTAAGNAGDGETRVLAVFCRTSDVLTEIDGYADGVKAAGDNRFMALMKAVGQGLFPSRDLGLGDTPE